MDRSLTTTTALLLVLGLGLALVPATAADHDGDLLPDPQEEAICDQPVVGGTVLQPTGVCRDRDNDGTFEDLDIYAFRMETILGPVCDTTENDPAEVCILRFFTLGQSFCIARAMAPAGSAVLVCTGGQIHLSCSGSVAGEAVAQWTSDADCDGHSNEYEASIGCDPLDPQSYPIGPMECSEGSGSGGLAQLGCSDTEDPLVMIQEILADFDCDGHSNEYELSEGCDPTDPTEYPGVPGGCSFGAAPGVPDVPAVPDPGELPVDPGELPVDPGELPVDPSELPVDPGDLPI